MDKELIGQKINSFKIIDIYINENGRKKMCKVQCECGSEPREYPLTRVKNGYVKSCGCSRTSNKINPKMGRPKKNIINERFDRVIVLSEDENNKSAIVRCDCGNEYEIKMFRTRMKQLVDRCACSNCLLQERKEKYFKYLDLKKGDNFNKLTVIKKVDDNSVGEAMYLCKCECGRNKVVSGKNLVNQYVKSCGCLTKNNFDKAHVHNGITMSEEGKKLYEIWYYFMRNMKNPDSETFKENIVEKGIKFFPEWNDEENSFINFYKWAMFRQNPFDIQDRRYLARIDTNKHYTTKNCYFARRPQSIK